MLHSLPDFLLQPGRLFVDKARYIEVLDKHFNYSYVLAAASVRQNHVSEPTLLIL